MPVRRLTYREIADDLIDRIEQGEYRPGDRLPSRRELALMYSVGTTTADAVMALVVDRGYAYSVHGVGTYVTEEPTT